MTDFNFSLGRNTYDNQPTQLSAIDFDDFLAQIAHTGSKRKGEFSRVRQLIPFFATFAPSPSI